MVSDSIKQDFNAEISKTNPHEILIKSNYLEGKKYQLTVLKESVTSYFESIAKSYQWNFVGDKAENYGTFTLNLINKPMHPFWIEIVDENEKVAYSKKSTEDTIKFSEMKPGAYTVRILVDNNENGVWDTADFSSQTYAEEVFMFNKKLAIKPFWEIVESWDLNNQLPSDDTIDLPETSPQNQPSVNQSEKSQKEITIPTVEPQKRLNKVRPR